MPASRNGKNATTNTSRLSMGKAYNPYPQRPSDNKNNNSNCRNRNQYLSSSLQIIDTNTSALLHGPPSSSPLPWTSTQISRELACLSISDPLPLPPLLPPPYESSSSSRDTTTTATTSIPFFEFLSRLQQGKEPTIKFKNDKDYIRIPEEYLFNPHHPSNGSSNGSPKAQFFNQCYQHASSPSSSSSSSFSSSSSLSMYGSHMILTNHIKEAEEYNALGLNRLPSLDAKVYPGILIPPTVPVPAGDRWKLKDLMSKTPLKGSGRPPLVLKLKVGLPIMLLEKIDGMCAGSIVIIEKLEEFAIFAREAAGWTVAAIGTGCMKEGRGGRVIEIRHQEYEESNHMEPPVAYKRLQFPVKRAFALAVDDVPEGVMFDGLGLDLTYPMTTPGKLPSTLSRCRDPSRLKVYVPRGRFPGQPGHYTRNRLF